MSGTAANRFSLVQAMAFDGQGALYVSDGGNHRVQKAGLIKDFSKLKYTWQPCHLRSHVAQSTSTTTMISPLQVHLRYTDDIDNAVSEIKLQGGHVTQIFTENVFEARLADDFDLNNLKLDRKSVV